MAARSGGMDLASYLQVRFALGCSMMTDDALAFTNAITPITADRPASCIRLVNVVVVMTAFSVLVYH